MKQTLKVLLETLQVAFGMFSRIPVKHPEWNRDNMRYALLAFPLVGTVLGLAMGAVGVVLTELQAPALLTGALLTALPLLITGGIHLDGYADTYDALSSRADREKKLEIMADPHTGAFAVMHTAVYLLLWFAAAATFSWNLHSALLWLLALTLSRTLSALGVVTLPGAKSEGLNYLFSEEADKVRVKGWLIALLVLLSAALVALGVFLGYWVESLVLLGAAAGVFFWYRYISKKHFGGITGDLSGWFLCKCELWMFLCFVLADNIL